MEEARRFFGVRTFAITGSAQPAGDQVEFTVNLVDALKARQIDSRTFLYDPKNPLVSRDQAINLVVRMMNLDVPAAAHSAIAAGDTAAPSAYSAYIEGRGLLARFDVPGNVDRAIDSFTKAAQQDPKYALAYAGLAESYWRKTRASGEKQWATLANQNAEYAVQLDGNLAIVHSVLGSVYRDAGRLEDATREFQRAMDLAPANAEAPRQLAETYKTLGRFDEAEKLYIRSTKSRPTDWYGHMLLGLFYYERERYPEAEAELESVKIAHTRQRPRSPATLAPSIACTGATAKPSKNTSRHCVSGRAPPLTPLSVGRIISSTGFRRRCQPSRRPST